MGGGLTVCHQDDLLGPLLVGQHLAGQDQPVLEVGPIDVVPADGRKVLRLNLTGDLGEPDQTEVVPREARCDQRVEGHGHLLGRHEVVAHRHRQRQVEEQHGGRAGERLGFDDLEVVRVELDRDTAARSAHGVVHGSREVEVERVTVFVRLRRLFAVVSGAGERGGVVARPVLVQLGEEVGQRLLADPPGPLRGELEATLALVDQSGLLELLRQLGQPVERLGGVLTQAAGHLVQVDLGQ